MNFLERCWAGGLHGSGSGCGCESSETHYVLPERPDAPASQSGLIQRPVIQRLQGSGMYAGPLLQGQGLEPTAPSAPQQTGGDPKALATAQKMIDEFPGGLSDADRATWMRVLNAGNAAQMASLEEALRGYLVKEYQSVPVQNAVFGRDFRPEIQAITRRIYEYEIVMFAMLGRGLPFDQNVARQVLQSAENIVSATLSRMVNEKALNDFKGETIFGEWWRGFGLAGKTMQDFGVKVSDLFSNFASVAAQAAGPIAVAAGGSILLLALLALLALSQRK